MSDGDGEYACRAVDGTRPLCMQTLPPSRSTPTYTILEWYAMPVDFAMSDSVPI